jgi:hypothetical protein
MRIVFQHLPADVPGDSHDGLFTGFGGFRQLGDGVVPQIVRAQTFESCFLGQFAPSSSPWRDTTMLIAANGSLMTVLARVSP